MWVTWWSLLDIVCDYNGLIHYYDIVGYTMVSLTSLTLWVAQWFLLFIRRCRWLQWSIYPFITLYTIITSDGETRYDLSIPLDCFTPRKFIFSEHFFSLSELILIIWKTIYIHLVYSRLLIFTNVLPILTLYILSLHYFSQLCIYFTKITKLLYIVIPFDDPLSY